MIKKKSNETDSEKKATKNVDDRKMSDKQLLSNKKQSSKSTSLFDELKSSLIAMEPATIENSTAQDDSTESSSSESTKSSSKSRKSRSSVSSKTSKKSNESQSSKTHIDNGDDENEVDKYQNMLESQKMTIINVIRHEELIKERANLRPCGSCEFEIKDNSTVPTCCWGKISLPFMKKRAQPSEFWIISVPVDNDKPPEKVYENMYKATASKGLSNNYKFHIPNLTGQVKKFLGVTEELKTLDQDMEEMLDSLFRFLNTLIEDGDETLYEGFESLYSEILTCVSRFTWNEEKYPCSKSLPTLIVAMTKQIKSLDKLLQDKLEQHGELEKDLKEIKKQKTGKLQTRSLHGIVKKEHFITDSNFLKTVLVIVPSDDEEDWLESYHTFCKMVLPKSAKKVFEENDQCLYTVIITKKCEKEFKKNAKKHKYVVRDFEYDEDEMNKEHDLAKQLKTLKASQLAVYFRWARVKFLDAYATFIHIKAMRVYVESTLRYTLSGFQAVLLVPLKKEKLADAINEMYKTCDSNLASGSLEDVPGDLQGFGVSEYFPYVYVAIKVDFSANEKSK